MTTALILNLVFAATIFTAVVGLMVWGIATAAHDRGVTIARRARRERRAVRPTFAPARSRRQAWPAS
jgi:hypothetical protein